jgi:hypothetical protein
LLLKSLRASLSEQGPKLAIGRRLGQREIRMRIDPGTFFILVGTIAASGAGGWVAHERIGPRLQPPPLPPPTPIATPEPSAPPSAKPEPPPPPAPTCDDSSGEIGDCSKVPRGPDPGDEGSCNLAAVRCVQYRDAFKPKVARAAIRCLERLKGNQICDPIAVNKCGHEALMAACPPDPGAGVDAAPTELDKSCSELLATCKEALPGPTLADCKQTLSGLNDVGRRKMAACMKQHCDARGLYGCEAR